MSKITLGVIFLAGIGAGYGLTLALSPSPSPATARTPETDSAKPSRNGSSPLERQVQQLQKEKEQLLAALDKATQPPSADDAQAKAPPQPRRPGMGRGMGMNVDKDISRLSLRLKLDPEQAAGAKKFLSDRAERQTAYFGELFSSGRLMRVIGGEADEAERKALEEELARNRTEESPARFREHLASSLTSEQLSDYDAYALNQKQNDASVFAMRQINEIGQSVDLDESQKDALFVGYVEMAMKSESDPRWAADAPPAMARSAVTGSLDMAYVPPIVQKTLTPVQLSTYQQSVQDDANRAQQMHKPAADK